MFFPNKNIHRNSILILNLFFLSISFTSPVSAGKLDYLDREIDPVVITGKQLPQLIDKNISSIRVFAFQKNEAVAIPFQIDQKDSLGNWVWDVALHGRSVDNDDPEKTALFDHNDELVFMALDTGDKSIAVRAAIPADVVVEIEILDLVNQTRGWVYAAFYDSDPPPLSPTRYMRYRPEDQTVISPIYEFSYSTEHIAVMNNLVLNDTPIMDRTKIRGQVGWRIMFLNGTINFNEDSIDGYMAGYIDGPVRTITRAVDYLALSNGMTTGDINCDHLYYTHHSEIPLLLSMKFPVKRVSMLVTTDYRDEPFDSVYVDGIETSIKLKTTSSEHNRLAAYEDAKWIALGGNIGSVLSLVTQPEELNNYLEVSPYLLQDRNANNLPEAYRGSTPETGYRISTLPGIPGGDYVLYITYLISSMPFQQGDENKLLNLINSPLVINATLIEHETLRITE